MTKPKRRTSGLAEKARRYASQRLFPPWLFMVKRLVIFRTSEVVPLRIKGDGIAVRWATRDDVPALDAINPDVPSHGRLFDRGYACSLAQRSGEPVSYLWFQLEGRHRSESNAFVFESSPGTCWATNMFVHPDHRMLGAFHHHWVEIMDLLAERGIRDVYHTSNAENVHSIKSHVRMGSRVIYDYRVARVAGLVHHHAAPREGENLPRSAGCGWWTIAP
jgi:hypothetical protein